MKHGRVRVGIGGWIFEPWRETFYPPGLPKSRELAHASRHVTTIEINATFYRTQSPATFKRWAEETPDDFVFAVKASRYATNRKNLGEAGEAIERFLGSGLAELGPKLGPILWQLAGTKKFSKEEIEGFLRLLPDGVGDLKLQHAIEPRHPSFQTPDFVELAREFGVAVVLADSDDYPLIADPTGGFCYLRLQKSQADEPEGYPADALSLWQRRVESLASGQCARDLPLLAGEADARTSGGRDCYVYFISGAKERNPAAAQALLGAFAADKAG